MLGCNNNNNNNNKKKKKNPAAAFCFRALFSETSLIEYVVAPCFCCELNLIAMDDLDAELALFEAEVAELDAVAAEGGESDKKKTEDSTEKKEPNGAAEIEEEVAVSAAPSLSKEYIVNTVLKGVALDSLGVGSRHAAAASSSISDYRDPINIAPGSSTLRVGPSSSSSSSIDVKKRYHYVAQQASMNARQTQSQKRKRTVRGAAGETWRDDTMLMWNDNDYRLFVGDLGNDVTDEMLVKMFNMYPTFLRARVVRKKGGRIQKTRGYGFVSFGDGLDMLKAMREKNGKYLGSRPIKLSRSTWQDRGHSAVQKERRQTQRREKKRQRKHFA